VGGILFTNIIQANSLNYITLYNDLNLNNYSIYGVNNLTTGSINVNTINVNTISNTTNINTLSISTVSIAASNIGASNISTVNLISFNTSTQQLFSRTVSTTNLAASNISNVALNTLNIATSNISSFFYGGIEKYNYISSSQIQSTVRGLGNIYMSSFNGSTNYLSSGAISGNTVQTNYLSSGVINGNTVQTQVFSNMATNLTIPQLYVDNYGGCNVDLDPSYVEITSNNVSRPFYTINNFDLYKVTISVYGNLTSATPTGTIDTFFTFSNIGGIGTGLGLDVNSANPYRIQYDTANTLRYTYTDIYDLNELTNSCNYKIRIFMKTPYITNLSGYSATIIYEPIFSNY